MKRNDNIYYASGVIAGIKIDVFSTRKGIRKLFLNKKASQLETKETTKLHPDDPFMFNIFSELKEYFNMQRTKFTVPLEIDGTKFQKKVWTELAKIPFGKLVSYKTIAKRVGNEKAARAVGRANGANPVPIIIPCHRVISCKGKIGGYSAGLGIKEKLLEVEGCLSLELF